MIGFCSNESYAYFSSRVRLPRDNTTDIRLPLRYMFRHLRRRANEFSDALPFHSSTTYQISNHHHNIEAALIMPDGRGEPNSRTSQPTGMALLTYR